MSIAFVQFAHPGSDLFDAGFIFAIKRKIFSRRHSRIGDIDLNDPIPLRRTFNDLLNGHKNITVRRRLIQAKHLLQHPQEIW